MVEIEPTARRFLIPRLGGWPKNLPWTVPIPGTIKLSRLEKNIGAVGIELTEADLQTIDEASSKIKAVYRYPEELEKLTSR